MSRIFYLGAPSHINLTHASPVIDRIKATGNNTGNMLIGDAIKRQLGVHEMSSDFSLSHTHIKENFDLIVIGAANFIAPYFDFEGYANFLEAVDLPCIIIGLGAQAPSYGRSVEIPKGTERMLRIISERSVSLGVRGYFTAVNLYDRGIKNVRVIGCPSMYWTCKPSLNLRWSPDDPPRAVSVNGSGVSITQSVDIKSAERVEAKIARLSFDHGYPYILQNESALMEIAANGRISQGKDTLKALMNRYGFSEMPPNQFINFVRQSMKTYFKIDDWIDAIKRFDFVVGTRFHGCLIALIAGVPCFIFAHDSRTREMCELMRIPHVDVTKANGVDISSLYASLDLPSLETAYRYLYQNYISFLEENGVAHSLA